MGAQSESAAQSAGERQQTDRQARAEHVLAGEPDPGSNAPVIELSDVHRGRSRLSDRSRLARAPRWKLVIKRILDIVVAAALLVVLSPIMAAAALAIRLTSRGPVLFSQERIGYRGEPFTMLKFRSMALDAEDRLAEVYELNEHHGPVFKVKDDPRITRVGKFLRRTSIDEMPQLLHVLTGEMSLVGPRPALPAEVEHYTPYIGQRLLAKPGLTCIWQVSGRSNLDFDTWVELDLDYIEQWTLRLDLQLLAETLPAVLSTRGAY